MSRVRLPDMTLFFLFSQLFATAIQRRILFLDDFINARLPFIDEITRKTFFVEWPLQKGKKETKKPWKRGVMTERRTRDIPLQTPGKCRSPFSGLCPNLASVVVLGENSTLICSPWLARGTPLSQLRCRLDSGTLPCTSTVFFIPLLSTLAEKNLSVEISGQFPCRCCTSACSTWPISRSSGTPTTNRTCRRSESNDPSRREFACPPKERTPLKIRRLLSD